ncbi:hypothetical protein BC739_005887 [Kutzneria viridogrisea]|uniref:DUF4276 family protein n=1 Tax=Kutzneria viridogrisea TaxID=47990 RepID=A0ABR6BP70_9PSEU|nr:hypothetical protein [Kutzneria viridogrisea]
MALDVLVPRIVPGTSFSVQDFRGKPDLLKRLPGVFRGLAIRMSWEEIRIVVLVDRDDDNCVELKQVLADCAAEAGLPQHVVLKRIVVDELEAWFFGDVPALCAAYPRVSRDLAGQVKYRDPEEIPGKASKALEHLLQSSGYHPRKLAKVRAATDIAEHMDVESNRSKSFQVFRDGLRRLVSEGSHAQED